MLGLAATAIAPPAQSVQHGHLQVAGHRVALQAVAHLTAAHGAGLVRRAVGIVGSPEAELVASWSRQRRQADAVAGAPGGVHDTDAIRCETGDSTGEPGHLDLGIERDPAVQGTVPAAAIPIDKHTLLIELLDLLPSELGDGVRLHYGHVSNRSAGLCRLNDDRRSTQ